jgi:hypothetical protein
MSYQVMPIQDEYEPRNGMEGPFRYKSGAVLYYDPREGAYYNPRTDFYLTYEEFRLIAGE